MKKEKKREYKRAKGIRAMAIRPWRWFHLPGKEPDRLLRWMVFELCKISGRILGCDRWYRQRWQQYVWSMIVAVYRYPLTWPTQQMTDCKKCSLQYQSVTTNNWNAVRNSSVDDAKVSVSRNTDGGFEHSNSSFWVYTGRLERLTTVFMIRHHVYLNKLWRNRCCFPLKDYLIRRLLSFFF